MTFNTNIDKSKRHSDLFFLKKSGNEKNTVIRIGEKIKRPTPGANSNPNDAAKMFDGFAKINARESTRIAYTG